MGNRNSNLQNNIINREQEQMLVPNERNENQSNILPQPAKEVFAVKNPILLKKQTLSLEKDATSKSIYYIKFNYDSLVNFDCYINFNAKKSISKPLIPNESGASSLGDISLSYLPSTNFESKGIVIKNLTKGENIEFLEKEAKIDFEYFFNNKLNQTDKERRFDIVIELIPIFEPDNQEYNEMNKIRCLTLCSLISEENEKHKFSIKCEKQKLKINGIWINLYEIFNSALDNGECLICCQDLRNTVFLPCNHSCTCTTCSHSIKMRNNPCPICKKDIEDLLIFEADENSNIENTIEIEMKD